MFAAPQEAEVGGHREVAQALEAVKKETGLSFTIAGYTYVRVGENA
jgi:hypothetical protein